MIIVFCPIYYPNGFLLHDNCVIIEGSIRGSSQVNVIVKIGVN